MAPWKGGVYVAAAPDIWYLKDTEGDNKADFIKVKALFMGDEAKKRLAGNASIGK